MSMFDTFDRTGAVEVNFPAAVVFRAASEAGPRLKASSLPMSIPPRATSACQTKASAFSWGEKVTVSISELAPRRATLRIASAGKTIMGSATTHGKNRKNVEQIIRAISDLLDEHGAKWTDELGIPLTEAAAAAPQTIGERLRRLDSLREQGLISPTDNDAKKQAILSEI